MAKVAFTKLGLKVNQEIKQITINEQIIEVKQYLPINDKLLLITDALNSSSGGDNYINWIKYDMFIDLGIVEKYTNISFTEKQKEDFLKLYDVLNSNGVIAAVVEVIPEREYNELREGARRIAQEIYDYKTSALGILETISTDYSTLDMDATEIQQKLADPENLELLKGIMTKLG